MGSGEIISHLEDVPLGEYAVVYADPPWSYTDKLQTKTKGGADSHYRTMTVTEIENLPVPQITQQNCFLFLWSTWPMLPHALEVINAWGFQYKTVGFCWVKKNKRKDTLAIGLGHYTRSNCEPCLLAVRGRPKVYDHSICNTIVQKRLRHSQKPIQIHNLIERLCGNVPRIELFARRRKLGWDAWGNEL